MQAIEAARLERLKNLSPRERERYKQELRDLEAARKNRRKLFEQLPLRNRRGS